MNLIIAKYKMVLTRSINKLEKTKKLQHTSQPTTETSFVYCKINIIYLKSVY